MWSLTNSAAALPYRLFSHKFGLFLPNSVRKEPNSPRWPQSQPIRQRDAQARLPPPQLTPAGESTKKTKQKKRELNASLMFGKLSFPSCLCLNRHSGKKGEKMQSVPRATSLDFLGFLCAAEREKHPLQKALAGAGGKKRGGCLLMSCSYKSLRRFSPWPPRLEYQQVCRVGHGVFWLSQTENTNMVRVERPKRRQPLITRWWISMMKTPII